MITFSDDEIDLFAQTLFAGYYGDGPIPLSGLVAWEEQSVPAKGRWRRAARALIRHLYHGQPVNKAPHHMTEAETDLIQCCDEYEQHRRKTDYHAVRAADYWAERLAEHFELIRRAIHRA